MRRHRVASSFPSAIAANPGNLHVPPNRRNTGASGAATMNPGTQQFGVSRNPGAQGAAETLRLPCSPLSVERRGHRAEAASMLRPFRAPDRRRFPTSAAVRHWREPARAAAHPRVVTFDQRPIRKSWRKTRFVAANANRRPTASVFSGPATRATPIGCARLHVPARSPQANDCVGPGSSRNTRDADRVAP